jgi:ABC-type glycerol-3-phosphate transport system substrate-binding protein
MKAMTVPLRTLSLMLLAIVFAACGNGEGTPTGDTSDSVDITVSKAVSRFTSANT